MSTLTSKEYPPLLDEHGRPYHPDMQLSWQTYLGNRGPQTPDVLCAYIAAWYAGRADRHAHETRTGDPETMRKLLVEARSYIQSFASLTKHPTAPKDASNLVARIQAVLRPQAPKIECDHRCDTDDSGEFCSKCGERVPPAQKACEAPPVDNDHVADGCEKFDV